jgi:hypothetical protein
MTLARNINTGLVRQLPDNVIFHRVLGKNWEVFDEDAEYEIDKTTIDRKVFDVAIPVVKAKAVPTSKAAEPEEITLKFDNAAGDDLA